jgi:hypothetical protein
LFVVSLVSGDDGGKGGKGEMDTGEGHQVGLEFVQVDVQRTVKSERGGDGRDDLGNQTVKVGEARRADSQVLLADIIDSLVVNHERTVGVLEGSVGGQDSVVRFDYRVTEPGGGINAELEFRLLPVISGKALEQESTETGTSSTTERVEDEETLETSAVIGQTPDLVHNWVDLFFADGIMATSVVAGGIFLASDEGLWVEKATVCTRSNLIDDIRLEVNIEGTGDVFSSRSFREESAESIITRRGRAWD